MGVAEGVEGSVCGGKVAGEGEAGLCFEETLEAFAEEAVVVDEEEADGSGSFGRHGELAGGAGGGGE